MVSLLVPKNNTIMKILDLDAKQTKIRTTLYLTKKNRDRLDLIPRGQKTDLMNRAIADALENLEREENSQKFISMIQEIEPVTTGYSSEAMVRLIREGKEASLLDNKKNNAE
jgi:hypothetical protein